MFKNVFSFNGRIRRTEFGYTMIAYFVWSLLLQFLLLDDADPQGNSVLLYFILLIPMLWVTITQGCKRCHDRGNPGWYQLIPFYGFWMLFADSDIGENEYGPNPKGIGNTDDVDQIGSYLVEEAK